MSDDEASPKMKLSDIETTWRRRSDPGRFALIYSQAMLCLLRSRGMLSDPTDAEEVVQEILAQVLRRGFPTFDPAKGKFRPYLKQLVRNAATAWERKKNRQGQQAEAEQLASLAESPDCDRAWNEGWNTCVIERALRELERHERSAGRGSLHYTVIRLTIDHPEATSPELAAKISERTGQTLSPEAFRKQLSRARRLFAELIVTEVRQTLDCADDEEVVAELAELGLLGHVREFLPEKFQNAGR